MIKETAFLCVEIREKNAFFHYLNIENAPIKFLLNRGEKRFLETKHRVWTKHLSILPPPPPPIKFLPKAQISLVWTKHLSIFCYAFLKFFRFLNFKKKALFFLCEFTTIRYHFWPEFARSPKIESGGGGGQMLK